MSERANPRPAAAPDALQTLGRGSIAVLAYFLFGLAATRLLGLDLDIADVPVEAQLLAHGAGCLGFCSAALVLPPSSRPTSLHAVFAAPFWYVVFLVAWVPFVLFVYTWVLHRLSIPFESQEHLLYFGSAARDRWQFLAAIATVVLVGPLAEEFAFRGYVRDLFATTLGTRVALFATAALFGLFHGLILAFPLALLGLLFGWLRERYASLAPAFIAHALHNGLTVGVMLAWPEALTEAYR